MYGYYIFYNNNSKICLNGISKHIARLKDYGGYLKIKTVLNYNRNIN